MPASSYLKPKEGMSESGFIPMLRRFSTVSKKRGPLRLLNAYNP